MNILIDFTQIPIHKFGVGVYALNLVKKIHEQDKENNYFVVVQNDETSFDGLISPKFHIIKVNSRIFRYFIPRVFLEQIFLPLLSCKHNINIFHSLHYSFPLFLSSKRIVTIHDMTFYKFPESHIFIKRYYFRLFLFMSSWLADGIIAVSKSTLSDYLNKFKWCKKKTYVIYHGNEHMLNQTLNDEQISSVKNKYNIRKDYILFIGTIEPRKNVKNIILAFNKILKEGYDYQLVIVGKRGWHFQEVFDLVKSLPLKDKVVFTGFADDYEKKGLMSKAKVFVYPSIYEGFGIPVLESLTCGIPTVTSNVSSLPEVAGDAALLIDPLNTDELFIAIKKLLTNEAIYKQLKNKATIQAEKFSWEKSAQETIAVYNSLK